MAIKIPKLPGTANAKTRIFYILAGVIGLAIVGYTAYRYLGGGARGTGASAIANAPSGLQSIPGGQLSPEYAQALRQANLQAAQQAQISGGSAVPTLVNIPGGNPAEGNRCILCPSDDNADVTNDINDLVKAGKLPQEEANQLIALAKQNVTPEEYAAALDRLVKEGKLTPDQARKLLATYRKQHENRALADSAKVMDEEIKSGRLPLEVANQLLDLQKRKVTPAEYQAELQRLVKEGKITPAEAARLLAQYTQQKAAEAAAQNALQLKQMVANGEITPAVAAQLADLQKKNASVDEYAAQLDQLVKAGKLTPEAAAKLLAQYKQQKLSAALSGCVGDLMKLGGNQAKEAQLLLDMQSKNAPLAEYLTELKRAVGVNLIPPEMASCILEAYQAAMASPISATTATNVSTLPGTSDFAKLQQRLQDQQQRQGVVPGQGEVIDESQFAAIQAQKAAEEQSELLANQQQVVSDLEASMSAQAQQLISTAWVTPMMEHKGGPPPEQNQTGQAGATGSGQSSTTTTTTTTTPAGAPFIKAGTIFFAVLDTGADSDYPDTPVMATIVQGPYKGAKLLGKIAMAQSQGASQPDRMSLSFNLMNTDNWPSSKTINAFAIDPDTARTVMASSVDYHYLKKYGAMMATSFLSGYANAIMTAGSTSTTGIFGTSSVHPSLSPGNKLAVGLGQMGTNLSNIVQNYTTIPPTVKINAGVGLGILFMADVTQ